MKNYEFSAEEKVLLKNIESVKQDLLKLPNVLAVGIGIKESGNQLTDEISYRVYVKEKIDLTALGPSERIPSRIGDFKTDVLTPLIVNLVNDVCGNERRTLSKHRPLKAGIAISSDSTSYGTLGWFGKLNADNTPILLTNKHVLYDATPGIDTRHLKTAQPRLGSPSKCCCCECGSDNVIGESIIGIDDTNVLTPTSVDCAISKINPDIASTIKLNISNDSTTEVLTVSGTGVAGVGNNVKKIGARSGFTKGVVVHIGDAAVAVTDPGGTSISVRTGQVLVIPDPAETYQVKDSAGTCKFSFANNGDSGSVILNPANQIIALLWGVDFETNTYTIGIASNIASVLTKLSSNGFPITLSVSPPGGGTKEIIRNISKVETLSSVPNLLSMLRDTNRESVLHKLYDKHHEEILDLINHSRPVTVVWQRNQGPAYVAALARAAREEAYSIPFSINEVSREALLNRLGAVLMEEGSNELKKDIAESRDDLIDIISNGLSIEEFAEGLKEAGFIDTIPFTTTPKLI